MAIDLSQFYQVFFDEAAEHLASMESLLLALDLDHPEPEDLNAIFRAAHSIKGSSGTFGFADMAEVTHVMETLLDRIRKGEARITGDMVDACLAAGDVLRNLLKAHRGEGAADTAAAAAICRRLDALAHPAGVPAPGPACFEVRFVPDPAIAPGAEQLAAMLEDLDALGAVHIQARPALGSGAPWCLRIDTDLGESRLRGVIEFMALPGSMVVRPGAEPGRADGPAGGFDALDPSANPPSAATRPEEEGWGLFADAPGAPGGGAWPADSPAHGLFADIPATQPAGLPASLVAAAEAPLPAAARAAAKPAPGDGSIRVSLDKVDQLINLVGELVITQAMLAQAGGAVAPLPSERLLQGLAQLERNTRDLQEAVMAIRMLPISGVFSRFPRVVRDLARKLGKRVELKTSGEATELDRSLIERLSDPLTHLVRNSLDHGIESPEERRAAGKCETGTITLKACHQGGHIVIEVGDDGAGLNRQRILAKARQRGLVAPDTLTDSEVWQLIFEPGFSTAERITEVSGRGVGMDVVTRNIAALGGRLDIESMAGIGTRMTVRLPLTLAILDGMSVAVGSETYILPLNAVVESLRPAPAMIRSIAGVNRLVQVRGEYLPVVSLAEVFQAGGGVPAGTEGIMVILEAGGHRAALFVEALIGQHQVVVKSLEANYRRVPGVSGATIMGDGRVALILDVAALVGLARRSLPAAA